MADPKDSFEQALSQLEQRVRALEAGDVPLDEALTLFEEGMELSRTCHEQLEAAEEKRHHQTGDGQPNLGGASVISVFK